MRTREADLARILRALNAREPIARLLVREGGEASSAEVKSVVDRARECDVPVSIESEREMRRMSTGPEPSTVLAVLGPPPAEGLPALMSRQGLVLLLVGLRYPSNVGFILRSAEVAGAAGVIVANNWSESEWAEAHRVSIRAERFFSVLPRSLDDSPAVFAAAAAAGRRIVAVETNGGTDPWQATLSEPTLLVMGSETLGISDSLLALADEIVRIPTEGFIPSYNVQAATGIMLGEYLRQTRTPPSILG